MRELREPVRAIFFCGLLFSDTSVLQHALDRLESRFGPAEVKSRIWEFDHTRYYEPEMGSGLKRMFVTFEKRIAQESLAEIKLACREIEKEFADRDQRRRINIDPGLLTPERIVLSSCKNFTHRIYIGKGVFAEITLVAKRKGFKPLEWTFPDYASTEIIVFWNGIRKNLIQEINRKTKTRRSGT